MPEGILKGLLQGYTAGKQHQRQSLIDQLEQQVNQTQLKQLKNAIAIQEADMKMQPFRQQLEQARTEAEQERLAYAPVERRQQELLPFGLTLQPGTTPSMFADLEQRLGGLPQTMKSLLYEPTAQFGAESPIQPIPGAREERQARLDYLKSQTAKQAQPKTETLTDMKTAVAWYMQENPKATRTQAVEWYKRLTATQDILGGIMRELQGENAETFVPPPGWDKLTPAEQVEYRKLKGIK